MPKTRHVRKVKIKKLKSSLKYEQIVFILFSKNRTSQIITFAHQKTLTRTRPVSNDDKS